MFGRTKLASIIAVILMLLMVLTACGGTEDVKQSDTQGNTQASSLESMQADNLPKELNLTVRTAIFSESPQGKVTQEKWLEKMEKYMGMKLNITWEEVTYAELKKQLPVYFASGDFADISTVAGASNMEKLNELGESGLIVDLLKYEDKLQNYSRWLKLPVQKAKVLSPDGASYFFSDAHISNHTGTQMVHTLRFDVLKKNNIKPPETMDEYYEVAKKLKELYPESYPVGSFRAKTSLIEYFLRLNRTQLSAYYNGNEYVFGPVDEADRVREVLVFLNKLYMEKLLDPEFFVLTSDQARQKMLTGKIFMVIDYSGAQINQFLNFNEEYPDVEWGIINNPKNFRGEIGWKTDSRQKGDFLDTGFGIIISSKAENADLLVKLVDYQYSNEMIELCNWGIEGVTFKKNADGTKEFLPAIMSASMPDMELGKYGVNAGMSCRSGIQFMPQDYEAQLKLLTPSPVWTDGKYYEDNHWLFTSEMGGPETVMPLAPPIVLSSDERDVNTNVYNPIYTFTQELVLKVVTGEEDLAAWDKYISEVKAKGDYKAILDIYNEKLDEYNKKYNAK